MERNSSVEGCVVRVVFAEDGMNRKRARKGISNPMQNDERGGIIPQLIVHGIADRVLHYLILNMDSTKIYEINKPYFRYSYSKRL